MRVTVALPAALTRFADGKRHVEVDVAEPTLAAVIGALGEHYPGVRERTLDDQGLIRRHVNVFVDAENVRFTGGLDTPVTDGVEVSILPAVSGGSVPTT